MMERPVAIGDLGHCRGFGTVQIRPSDDRALDDDFADDPRRDGEVVRPFGDRIIINYDHMNPVRRDGSTQADAGPFGASFAGLTKNFIAAD